MKARMYAKTGKAPKTAFGVQAKRVWSEIGTTPELATTIADRISASDTPLVTRQLPYRVTLYYILVFKSAGLVAATEPVVATVEDGMAAFDAFIEETNVASDETLVASDDSIA